MGADATTEQEPASVAHLGAEIEQHSVIGQTFTEVHVTFALYRKKSSMCSGAIYHLIMCA